MKYFVEFLRSFAYFFFGLCKILRNISFYLISIFPSLDGVREYTVCFNTPWKHQKTFAWLPNIFRGYKKGGYILIFSSYVVIFWSDKIPYYWVFYAEYMSWILQRCLYVKHHINFDSEPVIVEIFSPNKKCSHVFKVPRLNEIFTFTRSFI